MLGVIEQAQEVARKLGRALSLGEVHVSLGRTSEIVLHALVIEGAPGATGELARPLLSVPEAHLAVAERGALQRLGAHVALEAAAGDAVDREAGAVDADRLAEGERAERALDEGAGDGPPRALPEDAGGLDDDWRAGPGPQA